MKNANFATILWCGLIYAILLVVVILVVLPWSANAEQLIKIAILDTGYDVEYAKQIGAEPLKLCKTGHYDFNTDRAEVSSLGRDDYSFGRGKHGTIVASIIAEELKTINYCAIIFQIYRVPTLLNSAVINAIRALSMANTQGIMAINMSYGGYDIHLAEYKAMEVLADRGIMFFVAAGNDGKNLAKNCMYYPACYGLYNKITVGADSCPVSNYGKVDMYISGKLPRFMKGKQCYTSYATPRALSKYVSSVSQLLHGAYRQVPVVKKP